MTRNDRVQTAHPAKAARAFTAAWTSSCGKRGELSFAQTLPRMHLHATSLSLPRLSKEFLFSEARSSQRNHLQWEHRRHPIEPRRENEVGVGDCSGCSQVPGADHGPGAPVRPLSAGHPGRGTPLSRAVPCLSSPRAPRLPPPLSEPLHQLMKSPVLSPSWEVPSPGAARTQPSLLSAFEDFRLLQPGSRTRGQAFAPANHSVLPGPECHEASLHACLKPRRGFQGLFDKSS